MRRAYRNKATRRPDDQLYNIDEKTGCWNFNQCICKEWGYGKLLRDGKHWKAHRYFFHKYKAPLEPGLTIDHICRNRKCVNPSHLRQVSIMENNRYRLSTKLNEEKVAEIKRLLSETQLSGVEIAKKFNVSSTQVYWIRANKTWKAA